jgi:hypothetical protein
MKKKNCLTLLTVMGLVLLVSTSCKKNDDNNDNNNPPAGVVPTIEAAPATDITSSTAVVAALVSSDGGQTVTARGVCWSTGITPTISDNTTVDGAAAGNFTSHITGLSATTTYYFRAYATNIIGTGYSSTFSFTTTDYQVGDTYGGGIIFYTDGSGHGLIMAASDQGTAQWGCSGTSIGGTSTSFGTGNQNTIAIETGCTTSGTAADICANLVLNGYSDWYLPSFDELSEMSAGGLNSGVYWSSSQSDATHSYAYSFYMLAGGGWAKSDYEQVRAIRAY